MASSTSCQACSTVRRNCSADCCCCSLLSARLAFSRPPWKIGTLMDGPMLKRCAFQPSRSSSCLAWNPASPFKVMRGRKLALATPMPAVAACSAASARRMSGRRSASSLGTPTATAGNAGQSRRASCSCASSACGGCASRNASALRSCDSRCRSGAMRACSDATCADALDTCSVLATPCCWRASVRRFMSRAMLRLSSVIASSCRVARSCR
ncbi:hypothetical protein PGKDCPLP_03741 [Stenotrophomonas maltophilia]|nr:hypothetical protein PGKDCPLP_03741 [Stenotrophomonas maltophilia]